MDVGNYVLERLGRAWGVHVKVEMQGLRVISLLRGGVDSDATGAAG